MIRMRRNNNKATCRLRILTVVRSAVVFGPGNSNKKNLLSDDTSTGLRRQLGLLGLAATGICSIPNASWQTIAD